MNSFLIHKLTCFEALIRQIITTSRVRVVAEIGVETGETTRFLHDQLSRDASSFAIYSIDPNPADEFKLTLAELMNITWISKLSHQAIPELPRVDLIIVDGDHNYWTVLNELTLIQQNAVRHGNRPLIMLHDVCWPWARRDLYYNPANIPTEFLKPHSFEAGVTLDSQGHLLNRGFRSDGSFAAALQEGGDKNGVLTAVEDFLAANPSFDFYVVPSVFGLGLMVHKDHPAATDLGSLLAPYHRQPLLQLLEENRLRNYLRVIELQDQAAEDARINEKLRKEAEEKIAADIAAFETKEQEKNRQITELSEHLQSSQAFSARLVTATGLLAERYAKLHTEFRLMKQPALPPGRRTDEIIAQSIFFGEQYYRDNNKSVDFNLISPAKHYLQVGERNGRRPSLTFDPKIYVKANRLAERPENALLHYETIGRKKGYLPFALRYVESPEMAREAAQRPASRDYGASSDAETASFAAIRNAIAEHDIISFDVFDTLLARASFTPTGVFLLVAAEMKNADFAKQRIFAEKLARERGILRSGSSEVTLDDIYECITLPPTQRDEAKALELNWERQILSAYHSMKQIYDHARALSKTVVAVSDMYLSGKEIETLLHANGIRPDRVFSSSDHHGQTVSKHNGAMFDHVLKELSANAARVLHVGDNFRSDVENARVHGITSLRSRVISEDLDSFSGISPQTLAALREKDNLTGNLLLGMFARRLDSGLLQAESLQGFGYVYGGAIIAGFVKFLSTFARAEDVNMLLLFTRDGYVVENALRKLGFSDAKFELMHMSRQMAAMAGLKLDEKLALSRLFPRRRNYSLRTELQRIGVYVDVPDLNFEDRDAFISAVKLYGDELFNSTRERAELLRSYFDRLTSGHQIGNVGFVDVGWFLSSHKMLDLLLDTRMKGAYVGIHSLAHDNGFVRGMFFDARDRSDEEVMMKGTELLELVFSHPTRSTRGLRLEDKAYVPEFQDETHHDRIRNAYVRDMQRGLDAFLDDIQPYFHLLNADEVIKTSRDMWRNLIARPSRPEWRQLGGIPHALETGHSNFRRIAEYWDPKRLA